MKFDSEYKAKVSAATRNWQTNFPEKYILSKTKAKAKKYNLPFDLELSDIVIPEMCPVLGVKLLVGKETKGNHANANLASIDRLIPSLGYVKGNIQIISMQANMMKTDANREELLKFADWIYKFYKISSSDCWSYASCAP